MKHTIAFFLCLLLIHSCQKKEYTMEDLVKNKGLFYLPNTQTLFTGETTDYSVNLIINSFEQGQHIRVREFYSNGLPLIDFSLRNNEEHGYWREYYFSGQLKYEYYYVEGQRQGKARFYYENGQLQTESNYKDNILLNTYISYYEDGSLNSKGDSLGNEWTYYKDGKLHRYRHQGGKETFYNEERKEVPYEEVEQNYKAQYNS
ncbi:MULTISPECIES: toxin-antitoxin system YwqK family antitoxin [unclassified Myroides]|uniref:toxin-antitoxin system YwqK family antitoxin n=1 Tax=unclassified Myroides TaxID=2642485 RepID=UPI003D2F52FE